MSFGPPSAAVSMTADEEESERIDSITLEILWTRLIALADEAAATLVRTSFSPIVRESNDFACALFDAHGNSLAENSIGIPSFNVTMSRTLQHVLQGRPLNDWRPGDVLITNDPWLATGHLPDFTVLRPVFDEDRLVAWAGAIAHMADVGGSGWTPDTREVYEEGLRIPPSLLFQAAEPNEMLVNIIRANVRLPDAVMGDLMAMVAAAQCAGDNLLTLMAEAGIDDLTHLSSEIRRRGDAAMRRAVAAIPDGIYRGQADFDGTDDESIRICVSITVDNDEILVDYDGTSPQVSMGLNTVYNYTLAYTCYPIKCALDPATPRNGGTYDCITVKAPEGSILNPNFPAAVNARQIVGHVLAGVLYEALAQVVPDKVIADSGSAPSLRAIVSGEHPEGGKFSTIFFVSGGLGARPMRDGLGATCFPSTITCGAMEVLEAGAPIRIWKKEFVPDSGGPGEFRGGVGQEVEFELLGDNVCKLSLFVDRVNHPARGLCGGLSGLGSQVEVNGITEGFPLKGRSPLKPGDRVRVRYPGGGGFGRPVDRKADAVSADLRAGLISEAAAREIYGR